MGRGFGLRKPAGTSLEAVTRFRARGVTPAFFFPYSFNAKRIGPRPGRPTGNKAGFGAESFKKLECRGKAPALFFSIFLLMPKRNTSWAMPNLLTYSGAPL